jgi:hypothetical protein
MKVKKKLSDILIIIPALNKKKNNLIVLLKNYFVFKNMNNPILDHCKIYEGKFYISFSNMKKC